MAPRQTFEVGQQVMVKLWSNRRSGDHWEEHIVTEPVGYKSGSGWHQRHVVGEPAAGGRAYVGVAATGTISGSTYTHWVVNARSKVLSLKDYEPIVEAQQRKIAAEYTHTEKMQDLKRDRYHAMAEHIYKFGDVVDIQAILGSYFHLSYEGEKKADELISKGR